MPPCFVDTPKYKCVTRAHARHPTTVGAGTWRHHYALVSVGDRLNHVCAGNPSILRTSHGITPATFISTRRTTVHRHSLSTPYCRFRNITCQKQPEREVHATRKRACSCLHATCPSRAAYSVAMTREVGRKASISVRHFILVPSFLLSALGLAVAVEFFFAKSRRGNT